MASDGVNRRAGQSLLRPELRLSAMWLACGVGLVGLVWYLSLASLPPVAGAAGSDKLGHSLAYAAQAAWFGWLLVPRGLPAVGLWFVAQGALLELMQGMVATRSPELGDVLANAAGVAAGLLLVRFTPTLLLRIETAVWAKR